MREKRDLALSFAIWLSHGKLPNAMEDPGRKREMRGKERGRAAEERGRKEEGRENERICPGENI